MPVTTATEEEKAQMILINNWLCSRSCKRKMFQIKMIIRIMKDRGQTAKQVSNNSGKIK